MEKNQNIFFEQTLQSSGVPLTNGQKISNITAQIEGEISGQLAVGSRIIQIGSVYGGVVNIASPEQQPRLQSIATPVFLLPHPFPNLIGRKDEIKSAIAALESKQSVEFYSSSGLGKSVLLRQLAYHPQVTAPFPDGTISFDVRHQAVADLLQSFFDAFYESDIPYKPTNTQIRKALQGKQALIILDHQKLARDDFEELLNATPGCTFLLASPERQLWGEGKEMMLQGLPVEDALILIERELQRSLTSQEREITAVLWASLKGNLWELRTALATVREGGRSLSEVVEQLKSSDSTNSLIKQILGLQTKPQQIILAVLAALGGVALLMAQAAAMSRLADTEAILKTLVGWNLVENEGDRYSLNQTLVEAIQQEWDLTPWRDRALEYFTTWAQQYQKVPSLVLAETDAIFQILEWAVSAGRWSDILPLVKAVEGAFALGKRWGLWEQILQWGLQAAQETGDKAAEAWALHQLGSRALCLEDMTTAKNYLTQSLQIRESLGDEIGAAVTLHNLNLLPVPPTLPPDSLWLKSFLAVLLVGLTGWLIWFFWPRPPKPTPHLSLSTDSLNFGLQQVKTPSQPQTVILTNSGSALFTISKKIQITGTESNNFTITNNSCSQDFIQPQANCTVSISFQPTDVGRRNASLSITDNTADKTYLVQLTGEGLTSKPPNQTPKANPDTSNTAYFQPITIPVLENDRDPNGDTIRILNFTQGSNGRVSSANDQRSLIYQPNRGFSGEDTFTYTIQDANGATATATVQVTVAETPNQPPKANPDTSNTAYFQPITIPVLENDRDPNGDTIRILNFTQGSNGRVSSANDQRSLIYQPNRGFSGEDTFTYTIQDAKGATATATVKVTVAQESRPVANPDTSQTGYFQPVTIPVLENDRNPNGDTIRILNFTQGRNGRVSSANDQRSLIYQPNRGFSGEDTFAYTIQDANGATATATVTVNVAQELPVLRAVDDQLNTKPNATVSIRVLDNDIEPSGDPQKLTIIEFTQGQYGKVDRGKNGTLGYRVNAGVANVTDTFTYTIRDANGATSNATVTVTISQFEIRQLPNTFKKL